MGNGVLDWKIEVFLAVCRQGSFRKAAQELLVSQPSVSEQIQLLERNLGFDLFVRSPTGASPTEAGRFLFEEFSEMGLRSGEALLKAKSIAGHRPRLRVGTGRMQHSLLLDGVCYEFSRRHPDVEVEYSNYEAADSIDLVCGQKIEVVEFWRSPKMLGRPCRFTPVISSGVCLAVPRDHPLANAQRITPESLEGQHVATNADGTFNVVDEIKDQLRAACPSVSFVDASLDAPMEQFVMKGLLAIVPEFYQIQGSFGILVPLDVGARIEIGLLTPSDRSEEVDLFVELAVKMYS